MTPRQRDMVLAQLLENQYILLQTEELRLLAKGASHDSTAVRLLTEAQRVTLKVAKTAGIRLPE